MTGFFGMKWRTPERKLSILYDDLCPLCVAASEWMEKRAKHVECEFLKQSDPEVQKRYGQLLYKEDEQQFIVTWETLREWFAFQL
jgi:predicted DCC family thiol-disulfide oxidoreductase YuxK